MCETRAENRREKRLRQKIVVSQLVSQCLSQAKDEQDAREMGELFRSGLEWAFRDDGGNDQDARDLRVVC